MSTKCDHTFGENGWCTKCQWKPSDDIFPAIFIAFFVAIFILFLIGMAGLL